MCYQFTGPLQNKNFNKLLQTFEHSIYRTFKIATFFSKQIAFLYFLFFYIFDFLNLPVKQA